MSRSVVCVLLDKEPSMYAGKKVLVIDDDFEIVEAVRYALEGIGHEVIVARDGNQGIALHERKSADLIILDMMMPKRSGFLVLQHLRLEMLDLVPVIMITGNEGSRHKAYAEILGASDYIRKPFAMDRLLYACNKLLDTRMPNGDSSSDMQYTLSDIAVANDSLRDLKKPEATSMPYSASMAASLAENIGDICHALGNDVTGIQTYISLYKDVENATRCAKNAELLVNELAHFVHQYYRADKDQARVLHIDEIESEIHDVFHSTVSAPNVNLAIDTTGTLYDFRISELLFRNLLTPLLSHSFTERSKLERPGEIEVAISTFVPEKDIQISILVKGNGWKDSGPLIEQVLRPDRLWYSKSDSESCFDLRSVQRMIRRLGGNMFVEQSHDGVNVRLVLPCEAAREVEMQGQSPILAHALAELAGGISHDLANSIDAAVRAIRISDLEVAASCIATMTSEIEDLHRLVRPYYRTESDPIDVVAGADVGTVLLELVRPIVDETRVQIRIDSAGLASGIMIPRVLLRNLVTPLVQNSYDAIASADKGDSIEIRIESEAVENVVTIEVSDDGPGWPQPVSQIEKAVRTGTQFSTKGVRRGHGLRYLFQTVRRLSGQWLPADAASTGTVSRVVLPWE